MSFYVYEFSYNQVPISDSLSEIPTITYGNKNL